MWARIASLGRVQQRDRLSVETLRNCNNVLTKYGSLEQHTEQQNQQLIETLRLISETLIWGDQHDNSVFDFFLERNMLAHFKTILNMKGHLYVKVQLLQCLNIMFENIRNESSIYYLLSNNHINEIIMYKFDFSNEEILAYYISFLKTLSLRLTPSTIYFFFNEHQSDFPLYTEAVKFFNHHESMVRIAVRTITLNVCKVEDADVRALVCNESVAPYFSNLVWFMGNQSLELDECVQATDHLRTGRLSDLLAEHLDHLHYLHDMYDLHMEELNVRLTVHLLDRMLVPLYVYSLLPSPAPVEDGTQEPRISQVTALLLLSHVFSIFTHQPLVTALATELLKPEPVQLSRAGSQNENESHTSVFDIPAHGTPEPHANGDNENEQASHGHNETTNTRDLNEHRLTERVLVLPPSDSQRENTGSGKDADGIETHTETADGEGEGSLLDAESHLSSTSSGLPRKSSSENSLVRMGKQKRRFEPPEKLLESPVPNTPTYRIAPSASMPKLNADGLDENDVGPTPTTPSIFSLHGTEYRVRDALFRALECKDGDRSALPAIFLLYCLIHNPGVDDRLLRSVRLYPQKLLKPKLLLDALTGEISSPPLEAETSATNLIKEDGKVDGGAQLAAPTEPAVAPLQSMTYSSQLVERLLDAMCDVIRADGNCRLVTLEAAALLLQELCHYPGAEPFLKPRHLHKLKDLEEATKEQLRSYYDTTTDQTRQSFMDTLEYEYSRVKPLNLKSLMMDWSVLMPPVTTPLTGISLARRLPNGEGERREHALHAFFVVRRLSQLMGRQTETALPLSALVKTADLVGKSMDLANRDLLSCKIVTGEPYSPLRFLVVDTELFLLVEPDKSKLGCGVVRMAHDLQRVTTIADFGDPRKLHVRLDSLKSSASGEISENLQLVFDDHARATAATRHLQQAAAALSERKRAQLEALLGVTPTDKKL